MTPRIRTEYLVHHQDHSNTAGRQAEGATRTVKKTCSRSVPRLEEVASCSYLPRRHGLIRPAQPRQLGGVGCLWGSAAAGFTNIRQARVGLASERTPLRFRAEALRSNWPLVCTMVGFDGDIRGRKGRSGLRLVVWPGPAPGAPPPAPSVNSRRSTYSLKLAGRHDRLFLVEGRRKLPRNQSGMVAHGDRSLIEVRAGLKVNGPQPWMSSQWLLISGAIR